MVNNLERTVDNLISKAFDKKNSELTGKLEAISLIHIKSELFYKIQYLPTDVKKIIEKNYN